MKAAIFEKRGIENLKINDNVEQLKITGLTGMNRIPNNGTLTEQTPDSRKAYCYSTFSSHTFPIYPACVTPSNSFLPALKMATVRYFLIGVCVILKIIN